MRPYRLVDDIESDVAAAVRAGAEVAHPPLSPESVQRQGYPVKRLLSDPRIYVAWLVVLVAGLFAAYATDPHVFGFAVFGLGAATGLICIAGGFFVVMNPGASRWGRLAALVSLLLAVAALLRALSILGAFEWA